MHAAIYHLTQNLCSREMIQKYLFLQKAGWPRFGSVRLRFGDGTVRAVPVFGSGGSSKEVVFVCFSTVSQRGRFPGSWKTVPAVPVPRSVPAWNRFRRFRFPVLVRFLGHPEYLCLLTKAKAKVDTRTLPRECSRTYTRECSRKCTRKCPGSRGSLFQSPRNTPTKCSQVRTHSTTTRDRNL